MTKEIIQELCIAKRVYSLTGKIESGMINDAQKILFQMCLLDQKKPVDLIMSSIGGWVTPALSMFDFIKALPFNVNCTVFGECSSAALIILAACDQRYATENVRFLFHAMRDEDSFLSTKSTQHQLEAMVRRQGINFQQALALQSKAFSIPKTKLEEMMKEGEEFDIKLTSQEALQLGVIHKIVEKCDFLA